MSSKPNERVAPALSMGLTCVVSRNKWIIVGFTILGILAAIVVCSTKSPPYVSEAKLMLRYLEASGRLDPKERELLVSRDLATRVVAMVGPEKILSRNGGGNNFAAAARIVGSGIEVNTSLSPIITVSFKNRDKNIVQPVLYALIDAYVHKRLESHTGAGVLDKYWAKVKDLGQNLKQTEEALTKAKTDAGIPFLDDSKVWYDKRVANARNELDTATRELAEQYGLLIVEMERLEKEERRLLRQGYREAHPMVQFVRGQLRNLSVQKGELEKDFPALNQVSLASKRSGTNPAAGDMTSLLTDVKTLSARVAYLGNSLSNIQAQAARVRELEPKIGELERDRAQLQGSYDSMVARLVIVMQGTASKDDHVINLSVVQNPSPPRLVLEEMLWLLGGALVGCMATGVGLSFLRDLLLDRSIKSCLDVERNLGMPVFLAIPDTSWNRRLRFPWLSVRRPDVGSRAAKAAATTAEIGHTVVATRVMGRPLGVYAEGLRERVCTYFESHDMDLKNPKLVALTGCGKGVGVSTLASDLATELSRTGDENVLLLDLNREHGAAHSFVMGKLECELTDVVTPASRAEANAQEKLYVVSQGKEIDTEVTALLSKRFNYLASKLKATNYDYIVFDMPPVLTTNLTGRLASHMDLTLLIVESERTGQKAAALVKDLMHKSHANLAVVLNKCRQHALGSFS